MIASIASEKRGTGKTTVFGPVPSRRLGRSLGINNIPAKT
jgi:wyosine [tRNA(Phe)-imidazoG37] synthetase (radical SAM superfamily)